MQPLKYILPAFVLLSILFADNAFGQCAMCKAVASSNLESEANNVGKGLNSGILYLMAIPYLLLLSMGYLFFKDKIKQKIKSII
jgi:hypothetical protein